MNSGAVEHQDQHPIGECDAAPAERTCQGGDPVIEFAPGRGVTEEAQGGGFGLHQRVPRKLIRPVLPAREKRLSGRVCHRRGSQQRVLLP